MSEIAPYAILNSVMSLSAEMSVEAMSGTHALSVIESMSVNGQIIILVYTNCIHKTKNVMKVTIPIVGNVQIVIPIMSVVCVIIPL